MNQAFLMNELSSPDSLVQNDIQVDGRQAPWKPKLTWKKLTEKDLEAHDS